MALGQQWQKGAKWLEPGLQFIFRKQRRYVAFNRPKPHDLGLLNIIPEPTMLRGFYHWQDKRMRTFPGLNIVASFWVDS